MSFDLENSLSSLRNKSQKYLIHVTNVSNDIKRFEAELLDFSFGLNVGIELGREALNTTEKEYFVLKNIPGWKFLSAHVREYLMWERHHSSNKFRLIYCRTIYEDRISSNGEFSTSPYACNEFPDGVTERRPLIECPIEVRLRMHPNLSTLVRKIESQIDEMALKNSVLGGLV